VIHRKISMNYFVLLLILFVVIVLFFIYTCNLFPAANGYNRSVYAIVVYNDTNEVLNDIKVSYGCDLVDSYTKTEYTTISNLMPRECRKVQIPTSSPPIDPPYNVYVDTEYGSLGTGYFGIDIGGFAVVSIQSNNGDLKINHVSQNAVLYKKAFWKHRRHQNVESWY